jgi:hypothetical protein
MIDIKIKRHNESLLNKKYACKNNSNLIIIISPTRSYIVIIFNYEIYYII